MPLRRRSRAAARARELGLSRRLAHLITVPPGPDGRPGESFMAPSRNAYAAKLAVDFSRNDVFSMLSRRGSCLLVACLGRVADGGDPWHSANYTIDRGQSLDRMKCLEPPAATTFAAGPAVTYRVALKNGPTLREFKFERDNWLFAAGILLKPSEPARLERLARSAFATWEWIPATTTSIVAAPPTWTGREVTRSVTISRDRDSVWALLTAVDAPAVISDSVVQTFGCPAPRMGRARSTRQSCNDRAIAKPSSIA